MYGLRASCQRISGKSGDCGVLGVNKGFQGKQGLFTLLLSHMKQAERSNQW